MSRARGRLISLEGVTGAGKSTLSDRLRQTLPLSFASGGGYRGKIASPNPFHRDQLRAIRRQVARDEFLRLDWDVECLVIQAELLLGNGAIVAPALTRGAVVLYEHHQDSIYVYQAARLVEVDAERSVATALKRVKRVLQPFAAAAVPAATLYLDVDPVEAARRAAKRDGRHLTKAAVAFNEYVHEAYDCLYSVRRRSAKVVRVRNMEEAVATGRHLLLDRER